MPDYPVNDGRKGAIALIQRGLDCLNGKHDLQPCQRWHFWIMACPHCGYIQPEEKEEPCESSST